MQNGKSAAQNRWIAYNKMRGQYASAMEHAVPEQFWVDRTQCRYLDETGTIQNPTKADCAEAVSAVKAIAIAQQQGQRIYTINAQNAATALPALPIGGTVGQEVRAAMQAGKEVTIHESPITAHGWTGYGYTITDPDTGAGAYLIEGKGNGGILFTLLTHALLFFLYFLVFIGGVAAAILLGTFILFMLAIVLPVLGVMFATLSATVKFTILGLGIWTASELLLDGCYKAVGKLIGSITPGLARFAGAKVAKEAVYAFLGGAAIEVYKTSLEGCS